MVFNALLDKSQKSMGIPVSLSVNMLQKHMGKARIRMNKAINVIRGALQASEVPMSLDSGQQPAISMQSESCPNIHDMNVQFRHYLFSMFEINQAKCLERSCHILIRKLHENRDLSAADLSDGIQRFYTAIGDRVTEYKSTAPDLSVTDFLEYVEDFVCVHGYEILFGPRSEEEARDIFIQDRIRSLCWTTRGFLETVLNTECSKVDDLVHDAMMSLLEMNSRTKIQDKLQCLSSCSAKIFEAIRESTGSAAINADEFFPVLVYVVLRSNPAMLYSNVRFIQRFSLKFRTYLGESGYYFTSFVSAIKFIQEMNGQSLRMPEDVFEAFVAENTPSKS